MYDMQSMRPSPSSVQETMKAAPQYFGQPGQGGAVQGAGQGKRVGGRGLPGGGLYFGKTDL